MKPTAFPNLNTPLVDGQGNITKPWYQLMSAMYILLGGADPVSTPDLAVQSGQMDENFASTIELENSVEALKSALSMDDALTARMAELKNSLDALANGKVDGQTALIAEAQKTLAEVQAQISIHLDSNARLAELEKRLNDQELRSLFDVPGLALDYIPWTPFTPTLAGQTTAGNNTYANRAGYYMKLGRTVFLKITLTLSAKDAAMAGNIIISGFPFTAANDNARSSGSIGVLDSITFNSGFTGLGVGILPSTNYLRFIQWNPTTGASAYLTAANLTNTSWFDISIAFNI